MLLFYRLKMRTFKDFTLRCVLALLVLASCSAAAKENAVTIVYSGNLDGELEPCGCTAEGDMGGIKRRVTAIDRLRDKNPHLVLISAGGLLTSYTANEKLISKYILEGFDALRYDAVALQWSDLAYGTDFIAPSGLPWVSSNWRYEQFMGEARFKRNGRELAFFSWLDPDASPETKMSGQTNPAARTPSQLNSALERAKHENATTVLATTLTLEAARQLFSFENIDVLIIKASYEVYGQPRQLGRTLVLQPGSRGMRLGRVDLSLDDHGSIASYEHHVIPLPSSVPDAKRMDEWYDRYNAEVKEAYLESVKVRKAMQSGRRAFVGARSCKACHDAAYTTWRTTRHAKAYGALERVNKAFDPSCIGCHTVGFDKSGGFIDSDVTAHLKNVQCESCHGAARDHVTSKGQMPVANAGWGTGKICAQCHIQKHSPSFDIDDYWPKIAH